MDMSGYNDWQIEEERKLFEILRRKQEAGVATSDLNTWFGDAVAQLELRDKDARLRFEVEVPWWLVFWRWIKLQFQKVQIILFPRDRSSAGGEITNPVGDIPILGQLVGFGMEIGKNLAGRPDAIIHNQYGSLPFLSAPFELAGVVIDNWQIIVVGGVVLIGLFALTRLISIVRIGGAVVGALV
jgi:hypothetical protein